MVKVVNVKTNKVPRAKELNDITKQIEVSVKDADTISVIFKYAIVELGRQIAKQWSGNGMVEAASVAAQLNQLINSNQIGFANNYQFRNMLNEEYGIQYSWTTVDNCGTAQNVDCSDLYEDTEVRLIVQFERKVKNGKELAKLGVK